jgi:putative DNA-invertase from lambdoid prophage Rac
MYSRKYVESLKKTENATHAAVYLRVSDDRQTVENQRADTFALARARGFTVEETFEEQISAVKRRPAFEGMLLQARGGRFGAVIVWALDRFGRTLQKNLKDVWSLDEAGVALLSVREPWLDTSGPTRGLLLAVFAWVAEQERTRIIERVRAFQNRRRERGEVIGRAPYGWKIDPNGRKLVMNEEEYAIVTRVRELHRSGLSSRKLVAKLNASGARNRAGGIFSRTQVSRMLARPEGRPWAALSLGELVRSA